MSLSHINEHGEATMVDIGAKEVTVRTATAIARVRMNPETRARIADNALPKGDVFAAARIAGIMAAKKTQELIPLCHNIPIDSVTVEFDTEGTDAVVIRAKAVCHYKTGIEMEALTAAAVAALTIYDMCKAVDKGMVIEHIRLLEKTGGKSEDYRGE